MGHVANVVRVIAMQPIGSSPQSDVKGCICPFCPRMLPFVYVGRKTLMNHHRDTGNGHQIRDFKKKMPVDTELEWAPAVWTQWKGKFRWVRKDTILNMQTLPRITDGDFRTKSKFERVAKLLEKYDGVSEAGHPGFEMGSIGTDLTYYKDALLFMQRVDIEASKTRFEVQLGGSKLVFVAIIWLIYN